jgi:hypothetical protein
MNPFSTHKVPLNECSKTMWGLLYHTCRFKYFSPKKWYVTSLGISDSQQMRVSYSAVAYHMANKVRGNVHSPMNAWGFFPTLFMLIQVWY